MRRAPALLALLVAVSWLTSAGSMGRASAQAHASLADLRWLVGHWAGTTANGQHIEEMWMPARDGHMAGVFRWERGEGRWLFELLTIDERDGLAAAPGAGSGPAAPLTMRIKHFDRLLRGMEERTESTTLTLFDRAADRLVFEMKDGARVVRVSYVRTGPDSLQGTFDEVEPGKPAVHIEFPYERVR